MRLCFQLKEKLMQLYGLKTCDTTRKALKTLREAGVDVAYIDVRSDGVPADLLSWFLVAFGDELVNKRSTTWRGLSDSERAGGCTCVAVGAPDIDETPCHPCGRGFLSGMECGRRGRAARLIFMLGP